MMVDFNLEYFRAFYYTAQLKAVSKAADALFISQPAVSNSIKLLEDRLKCKLFVRKSRGMQLTYEGELLFARVSKAFDELFAGERELVSMSDFPERTLKIGITETALHHFLVPKIEQFKDDYPKVRIHVTGSTSPEAMQMLLERKVELAVVVSPITEADDLTVREISDFSDIFIAGLKFAELENRTITPRDICEYPIAAVEVGTSARNHIDRWFKEHGGIFGPEYSVRTTSAIIPFVERGLAVGIIPSMFAEELIQQGKIFQVKVEPRISPRQIVLMYQDDIQMSSLGRAFIKHLVE